MSICFKIFILFDRYNGQIGAFEILRLNETKPSLSLLCKVIYDLTIKNLSLFKVLKDHTIYFDGIWTFRTNEKYNLRNKWNSFCMSLDFLNDSWLLYINGYDAIKTNITYEWRKNRRLNEERVKNDILL